MMNMIIDDPNTGDALLDLLITSGVSEGVLIDQGRDARTNQTI